ncbi:MAG: MBL fold metallo-hydrolase [Candidatus Omnitrophica bacterium]|nr:MBL fold metallo-hydrolase [Candidatus Omnitrophota bacterium]
MIFKSIPVGFFEVNCYILAIKENSPAIIIDPGDEKEKIKIVLDKFQLKPALIINTHGHIDHIGCDEAFGVEIYIHKEDVPLLKNSRLNLSQMLGAPFSVKGRIHSLEDKENIKAGEIELQVIHVPGHTPGGIALLMRKPKNNLLFTGDTLFCLGIGRTDFPGADETLLIKSIKERLLILPDDTVIYPGHGPSSTIGKEKKDNPFLN